ncbi:hypothetical protein [Nocardia sp. NPDC002869]|uniref:hypothetical protein n=1 Tax=Nocardia sp. NPDC002869 TaxID=3161032 RepID=UPI00398CD5EB
MTTDQKQQTTPSPADPAYYAARGVTNEIEQQMRADAVRAVQLRDQGLRAEKRGEYRKKFGQADALHSQWEHHDSAQVRVDWEYLTDARADWRHSPGTMERLYEQVMIDRVDGVTSGMSPVEWRSQRQAREMAGRGQWPQVQEAFGTRPWNIHPMDPRSAEYWADTSASWGEQLMRADFAHVHLLDRQRGETSTDREYVQVTEWMHAVSEPWITRTDEFGETWRDMRGMSAHYREAHSEEAIDRLARQYRSIARDIDDPLFSRSVEQVHHLGRASLATESSVDSSRNPSVPASSARAAARTAELARGNAFAGLSTNAFDGGPARKGLAR